MSKPKSAKRIAYFCVILILVLVMIYSGLQIVESTVFYSQPVQAPEHETKTVTVDGVSYYPRQDITTLLVMGIDETGPVRDSGDYRNHGECDVVLLLIFDEVSESYTILALNRDTMLDMPQLGLGGKQAGTGFGQLALSHTYGSGLEDSCENTRKTVSDFLMGIHIDYYVAMNMDAIGLLNDAVGGVKVTVTEDFSRVDPSIPMGEVVLDAAQALSYVQTRKDLGDQLNVTRMQRHTTYMRSFMEALREKVSESESFVVETYETVSPYLVTDCSTKTMTALVSRFAHYQLQEIVTPEGENVLTEQYYEFWVDAEKLEDLVLRLLYAPK